MSKWHANVAHTAKHMNMMGALFGWGPGPLPPPLNPALLLWQTNGRKNGLISWTVTDLRAGTFFKVGGHKCTLKRNY